MKENPSTEKVFEEIQHHLMLKTINKLWVKGNFLNVTKVIYEESTANILSNVWINVFPPKDQEQTRMPAFTTST